MPSSTKLVDHRLQIIYRLLNNLVVKQEKQANLDPNEYIYAEEFRKYMDAIEQIDSIVDYQDEITYRLLKYYHNDLSDENAKSILKDVEKIYNLLDYEKFHNLITDLRRERILSYVEKNPYYRMLIGVPPIDTDPKDFVYYKGKIVHEMTASEIVNLKKSGALEILQQEYPNAKYLRYIDKRINLIEARKAKQFEIIWSPKSPEFNVYREMYNRERKVWMVTYHQEHLTRSTDFNESLELTMLKMRAIIYYFIHTYTTPLGKTSFSREESEDIYRSFGLTFPQHMPDSYRNATTYVLNYLTMYKGTNYVLEFIAKKLFSGLTLYKYFIRKRRKPNVVVTEDTKPEDIYDVDFILKPFDATNPYDDHKDIKTKSFATPEEQLRGTDEYETPSYSSTGKEMILKYDEVKLLDPRWSDSDSLKKRVFSEPFSYVDSKYLAVDNIADIHEVTIGLSVVHRYFLQHRDILKKVNMVYNGTSASHDMWSLWVFFQAIITYSVSNFNDKPADVVDWPEYIQGFKTIKTHPTIRMYWLIVMAQYGYQTQLEKFPNAVNSDTEFNELLINTDRAIGLAKFVDTVMMKANTHVEVEMIQELYRHVRIVNKKDPMAYNSITTEQGSEYIEYLETESPELYAHYINIIDQGNNAAMMEVDNMSQFWINMLTNIDPEDFSELKETLHIVNMLFGGISRYLMYILKLFKAWRVEFISEGLFINYNERYNFQVNVDQITPDVKIKQKVRWNVSQYDWLETISPTDPNLCEKNRNEDALYMNTIYGDVKIS